MKYEVIRKQDLGSRNGLPISTHYTLDSAMEACKKHSKGTSIQKVYNPKLKNPNNPWADCYENIEVPDMVACIERGNKQSLIRGWGIGGKFLDAKDCRRCGSSGFDANMWNVPCRACGGASYRPKV
jgi:hypothetical protein